ncbi:MAG: thermonuclease family protein [bacterium]|nr:thermonuclease family protein [bacterium]
MKEVFKKNRLFWAIVIGTVIVVGLVYFSVRKESFLKPTARETGSVENGSQDCGNIPELADSSLKLATKVIDGDTFLIEGGSSVRILGIDADERGYPCYEPAKNKLEKLILNKEVKLEKSVEDKDQYCRYLRYVFVDSQNISLELVKEGLAIARFYPENIKYRQEITQAEKEAKENKIGCEWSSSVPPSVTTEDKSASVENSAAGQPVFQWEKLTPALTGLEVVDACQAGNYSGKEVIVEGKVADAYHDSKSNTVFLNFEKPYPNQCFTGVIFSSNLDKFSQNPEKYYSNKAVRIMGEVKEYKGKPEIILEEPSQIEIGK